MKRIAYSFLLVLLFLLSCRSSPNVNYHTWIRLHDSLLHDYSLISVRNEALLVTSYQAVFDKSATVFSIPLSRITQVYQEHEMSNTGTLVGRVIGFFAGLFGFRKLGDIDYGEEGSLLGHNFDKNKSEYNVHDRDDLMLLKEFALFPDKEPPELQKIK